MKKIYSFFLITILIGSNMHSITIIQDKILKVSQVEEQPIFSLATTSSFGIFFF